MLYRGVKCYTSGYFPRNSTKTMCISLAYQQSVTVSHIRFLGISTKGSLIYFLAIPSKSLVMYFLSHVAISQGISTKCVDMDFIGIPTKSYIQPYPYP